MDPLTPSELDMMRHATAFKGRNWYCVGADSEAAKVWAGLCDRGLAYAGQAINAGRDMYYHLTASGMAAAWGDREGRSRPGHWQQGEPQWLPWGAAHWFVVFDPSLRARFVVRRDAMEAPGDLARYCVESLPPGLRECGWNEDWLWIYLPAVEPCL